MATIKISNPAKVTATDTIANEYIFDSGMTKAMQNSGTQYLLITIASGTWKFGVGKAPAVESPSYVEGDEVRLPVDNGNLNLWATANAADDEFNVSAI